jgi:N-glycosylase/DNA lyase
MARLHEGAAGGGQDRDARVDRGGSGRPRSEAVKQPEQRLTIGQIHEDLAVWRTPIHTRLSEFGQAWERGDEAVFKELCFCILAANSSAEMGIKTLAKLEDLVWDGPVEAMQARLSGGGFRYWRIRPAYIVATREHLRRECGLKLRAWLRGMPDAERRDRLALDKGIKGIGFKEASHFLRNIGFKGHAILDKHILNCLRELGVIGKDLKPTPARRYRLIERRMRKFAGEIQVDMDELDLLLWRYKTGKILK